MKKILKQIHLWLSIPIGIFFSLMCLTGAILVYEDELLELFQHKQYFVEEVKAKPLPLVQIISIAQAQLPDSLKLASPSIPLNASKNYSFSVKGMRKSAVYVDPYTGNVRGIRLASQPDFMHHVMRLHRWLLMPMKRNEFNLGRFITGWTAIISVFILLSGLIIWIPKSWKTVKRRLTIKTNKGSYRFWFDFHLVAGMFSVTFLLALCLTGLTWSFPWYRTAFYKTFGVEIAQPKSPAPPTKPTKANQQENEKSDLAQQYATWQTVINELKNTVPQAQSIRLYNGTALVVQNSNARMADTYTFNKQTGKITNFASFQTTATKQQKVQALITQIHFGTWASWCSKLLTFLAALVGFALPLSGYYIWIKKKMLKAKVK